MPRHAQHADADADADREVASRRRSRARHVPAGRVVLAVVLAAGAVLLAVKETRVRSFETSLLAHVLRRTVADRAVPGVNAGTASVVYQIDGQWFGLRITMACSVGLLLAVVAAVGALVILSPRVAAFRALAATAVGLAALIVLNQIRLIAIAVAYGLGGTGAYGFVHGIGGSVLMLVGLAAVLLLFFVICFRPRRRAGRPER
jgi:exosortase/archaeosortase family protein